MHAQGLESKNWCKMSVTVTIIFGRWELAVADDVYIRNGSGTNIGEQTYNTLYFETNDISLQLQVQIYSIHYYYY
jgi:hypothetical protein